MEFVEAQRLVVYKSLCVGEKQRSGLLPKAEMDLRVLQFRLGGLEGSGRPLCDSPRLGRRCHPVSWVLCPKSLSWSCADQSPLSWLMSTCAVEDLFL